MSEQLINKWLNTFNFWISLGGWSVNQMKDGKPSKRRKLTPIQVLAIRNSKASDNELAAIFKCSTHTVYGIKKQILYRDLEAQSIKH